MSDENIRVSSPTFDAKNHFEVEGQTLRLYFSDDVIETNGKKAPNVVISPAVKGKTVWEHGSAVEFRADAPFDPDVEYTVELPALKGPSGRTLQALKATFKATPAIEIAGKTIHYIPKKGEARPIIVTPRGTGMLGGSQEVTVVYDQAVDLALAQKLVEMHDDKGNKIPASIRRSTSTTFEGEKVDPRFVVVMKPMAAKAPGTKIEVVAKAENDDADKAIANSFTIIEPTKFAELLCRDKSECELEGDKVIKLPHTSNVRVKYSNALGLPWDAGKKFVHVTPAPKNLYVSGYEELSISGSFAPSTTYSVHVDAMLDQYGGTVAPLDFTFKTRPLSASATMSEGVSLLDEESVKAFTVTTRNVEKGELRLWALPKGDAKAFSKALADAHAQATPEGESIVVPFTPTQKRDENVDTNLDLAGKLERGRAYVAKVNVVKAVPDAAPSKFPVGSDASQPSIAILFPAGPNAIGAHVHQAGAKAVVQVFGLASGTPMPDAKVSIGDATTTTDATGMAVLAAPVADGHSDETVVAIVAGEAQLMMPLSGSGSINASALFSDLAPVGDARGASASDLVGMLVTDRGVYRPGSKVLVKAFVRKQENAAIKAAPNTKVRLRVVDPTDTNTLDEVVQTNARGWVNREVVTDKSWHTGRYRVRLELDDEQHTLLADEMIRVSDFEAPKFKVDVDAQDEASPEKIKARVSGRYLFGAPMSGARVNWTIRKNKIAVNGGAFADAGLVFDREYSYWEDRASDETLRPMTGEGQLDADGALLVDAETGPLADGPTELILEADVTDTSNRHVAGQLRAVKDPFQRHAGLKLSRRFGEAGQPLRVDLGVVDRSGAAVAGSKVVARIERLTWTRTAEKAESGAIVERWQNVATTVGQCDVVSAKTAASCELPVVKGGSYRVTANVDDRDDSSVSFWAYGNWGGSERDAVPSSGKKVPLVLDKAKYKAGETAKLLAQSPYEKATALLTVEQGGILHQESKVVTGPSVTFDIPVTPANAPWMNAAVTLLPIGTTDADYRVGAVRVPVGAEEAKLEVKVSSAKKQYEVRDDAELTIEVSKGGVPVKNADVTLAVVDEGVLRMTSFHAKDPVTALRQGRGLDFRITDSRAALLKRRERAHVAGGGDGTGEDALDTRKNFVETAAWLPDLTTDDKGRVVTKVKLPDNLTEFRMMAVVVDDTGRGGSAESSFVVSKPLLLDPVMPRFALRGDTFEAAAMVHNNTDAAASAKVTVAGQVRDVTVPPHGHQRVSVPMNADKRGTRTMRFALEVGGVMKDNVEVPLRIDEPGIDEHPQLSGVFGEKQEVHLEIPGDATYDDDAALSIKTGSALYPELGQRLAFLLDYPHGCVEQTTSSTLPLLAARTLLPWTGATPMEDAELRKRIEVGITRLSTMQTAGGGLSYWPGGGEPNVYGTAYAMRALLRAKEIGIEKPKLVERTTKFLTEALVSENNEIRLSIAEVLAQAKALPEDSADSLFDMRDKVDPFGLASLALALSSLPKQDDRVKELLDMLEASFDEKGLSKRKHDERDWYYWGSNDRDRAQAVIALSKLRKDSKLLPVLAAHLSRGLESWTTQSTAWSLLALADFVGTRSPNGGVDVDVKLEGRLVDTYRRLGGDNKEVRIPLKDLAGKKVTLLLKGSASTASAFTIEAKYKRPLGAGGTRLARHAKSGVGIHRAYSDAKGNIVDLANVKAGDIVRVALRIELPEMDSYRRGYVAITDRLPAGLEAIDPDLSTTAFVPDLSKRHPFYDGLSSYGAPASHVDLRDDKVQLYFDRVYGDHPLYATYLTRATTPGKFTLPPAAGEMMYEPDSTGYSDAGSVNVK
ncbi:hypothetical protein AKJ09_04807 [Labilithrix luteola]|uniref:Alpha-2-macroglobulin n=1 Tax=Labilithrix luteola TaxID=1391654 RepID=A0A0K1PX93_9BACT|nr:hypothetical protein AKJ09_04807 [Labilithrix luteola]